MPEFEKLIAWRKAQELAIAAYRLSRDLPTEERFGLADQIRRAAASVPVNIAEGHGRRNKREFAYFLRVALGSASELQSLMLLARDLNYLEACALTDFWDLSAETRRVVQGLHRHVTAE
jgi:four helix bundle protein